MHCVRFIPPLLLPTPTIWFSLDHKRNVSDGVVSGVGRNGNVLILLTLIPSRLWLRLRDSNFWFSVGHKRSYDSAYDSDSDSIVSENQPLPHTFHQCSGFWLVLINKATWSYKERKENKIGIWGQTWDSNSQPPAQIIFDSNCAKEVKIECCLQHSTTALVYY